MNLPALSQIYARGRLWFALLLPPVLLLLGSCQSAPWTGFPLATQAAMVWPAPPEPPRVAYVMQIRRHQDLFSEAGGWNFIQRLVGGTPDSSMVRPFAVAIHPEGGLLVSDPGKNCIHYYCWARRCYVTIGPQRDGGLPSPVGVVALPDGRIIVSDSRLGHLEAFDHNGKPLGPFGALTLFKRPAGLAADHARQQVYVADVSGHAIVVLDMAGNLVRRFGQQGDGNGQFNFPTYVATTPDGNLAISDSLNFRIQIVTPEGKWISKFGELGDAPGHFSKLKGVACDSSGDIFAVEGLYDALQIFTNQGQLLLNLGSSGNAPGQFWLPNGVCFDTQQHLFFVADSYNSRVQVFRMLQDLKP